MWTGGVCEVEVWPSPNVQAQLVGVPVEVSVNVTLSGTEPVVGDAPNEATGRPGVGAAVATVMLRVAVLVPPELETVRVIV